MFIVVDLDGTLCDGSHRFHLLQLPEKPDDPWPEQDFGPFNAAAIDDAPIGPMYKLLRTILYCGTHKVEFWTGRGEAAREVTQAWLDKMGLQDIPLIMRPYNQPHEPDHMVKFNYIRERGIPDLVFEDRKSVVDIWREAGITCYQVAAGDY